MEFDKSWLSIPRFVPAYLEGVRKFIALANERAPSPGVIICPCTRCMNCYHQKIGIVEEHLVIHGMDTTYKTWYAHGEFNHHEHTSISTHNMSKTFRMFADANIEVHDEWDPNVEINNDEMEDEDVVHTLEDSKLHCLKVALNLLRYQQW